MFVEGLLRLANVLEATNGTLKNVNNICTLAINSTKYLYPPQTKFGGVYRNHPVRLSMYLVSATPKRLIGFFMKLYTTCRCA
jgi:hypothetical protein